MTQAPGTPVSMTLMVLLLFATQACTDIFLPGLPAIAAQFGVPMPEANVAMSACNDGLALIVLFIGSRRLRPFTRSTAFPATCIAASTPWRRPATRRSSSASPCSTCWGTA